MSTSWWLITTAALFGWAVTLYPLWRPLGAKQALDICREPATALTVQAIVLWLAGTSAIGTAGSFAAGGAAMFVTMKLRGRKS